LLSSRRWQLLRARREAPLCLHCRLVGKYFWRHISHVRWLSTLGICRAWCDTNHACLLSWILSLLTLLCVLTLLYILALLHILNLLSRLYLLPILTLLAVLILSLRLSLRCRSLLIWPRGSAWMEWRRIVARGTR
jgi:hypothetical protein